MDYLRVKADFEGCCDGPLSTIYMLRKFKNGEWPKCPLAVRWIQYHVSRADRPHAGALDDLRQVTLYPSRKKREQALFDAIENIFRLGYVSIPERETLDECMRVLCEKIRRYILIYIFL